jgi:hypothetical protein
MIIVKLTFNYDWPLFRQTPNFSQIWGNYKFVIDDDLTECDFWIIYSDYNLLPEKVKCPPKNIIFIPAEGYNTSPRFTQKFLNQFGLIITVQRELKHKNIVYSHNANPWFVGKSYDELMLESAPEKTKLISVVSSNKIFTEGHQKRFNFVQKLKEHFGNQIDVFGRGINDFDDKWDVLANYKYTIAIENNYYYDYVTEKYFDCVYANSLPFYYGCPNLETYVNKDSFIRIDINDFESSIKTIENAINNNEYEKRTTLLQEQKIKSLQTDQFFPWIVSILENLEMNAVKKEIQLQLNIKKPSVIQSTKFFFNRIKNKLNRK